MAIRPEYKNLEELKEHYVRGGIGDGTCKKFLNEVLNKFLEPMRQRRHEFEQDIPEIFNILKKGTERARETAAQTMDEVRKARWSVPGETGRGCSRRRGSRWFFRSAPRYRRGRVPDRGISASEFTSFFVSFLHYIRPEINPQPKNFHLLYSNECIIIEEKVVKVWSRRYVPWM